jgi:hypothetical protein
MMTMNKLRIAFAVTILALAAVSAVGSASALGYKDYYFRSPFWDFGP